MTLRVRRRNDGTYSVSYAGHRLHDVTWTTQELALGGALTLLTGFPVGVAASHDRRWWTASVAGIRLATPTRSMPELASYIVSMADVVWQTSNIGGAPLVRRGLLWAPTVTEVTCSTEN